MSELQLQNSELTIKINTMGAELCSIVDNKTKIEYLWDGKPEYWARRSPVLFPIVGGLKNKQYQYKGTVYSMGQHGFARDKEFNVAKQDSISAWFQLQADEETKKCYPFLFSLEIGYQLKERTIDVIWKVTNQDNKTLYFSIGGHPAFFCPINKQGKQTDYYIGFDTAKPLTLTSINENSLAKEEKTQLTTEDGFLKITDHLFDQDALVIEGNQAQKVCLANAEKKPYITVTFDAPLFGVWSPAKKNAPFICIEPWYGRCDSETFNGTLEEREWGNELEPNGIFEKMYQITINS